MMYEEAETGDGIRQNWSHTPQEQTYQNPVDMFAKETASGLPFNSNRKENTPSAALSKDIRKDISDHKRK